MRLISVIDAGDYEFNSDVKMYDAARAIIFTRDGLLMLKSSKNNYYTFPGGEKQESDETIIDTLKRETNDETGYVVNDKTIKEIGTIIVINNDDGVILNTTNHFFTCELKRGVKGSPFLTDSEIEEGLESIFIDPKVALEENEKLKNEINKPFIFRDIDALKFILDNPKYFNK